MLPLVSEIGERKWGLSLLVFYDVIVVLAGDDE